jgi:putative hydrolase of the HAD superfamily
MREAHRILGVVFDAVGTLLLLREPVGETYARFARAHGVAVPASRLGEAFGRVLAVAPPNVHTGVTPDVAAERERGWWRERVRETFCAADGMARFDDFDLFFARLFSHYAGAAAWRLAAGATQCLASLEARGLSLGVLSNFDRRLRGLLESLGLQDRFAVVTLPSDAGAAKPERAIFEACLARLGLPAERVLYVGDRAQLDIAAAHQAGLHALDVGTLTDLSLLPDAIDDLERELARA